MTKYELFSIVKLPAAILRKKTKKITKVGDDHRKILKEMVETMRKNNGIGLAAPQVGLDIRVAVVDTGEGLIKMINPSILKKDGWDAMDEGCLSVPETSVRVRRSDRIMLEYTDEWGKRIKKSFGGLTAKAIQHEIDHLNGRLIIDYLPWYKRVFSKKGK